MAKIGRPKFEITDEVVKKAGKLAEQGLTKEQIARCLGITYETLNEKTKEYSNFSEAIKNGAAKGVEKVTNALFNKALNGDTTAQIFFLKCRSQWKEARDQLNVSVKADDTIKSIEQMTEAIRNKKNDDTKSLQS